MLAQVPDKHPWTPRHHASLRRLGPTWPHACSRRVPFPAEAAGVAEIARGEASGRELSKVRLDNLFCHGARVDDRLRRRVEVNGPLSEGG